VVRLTRPNDDRAGRLWPDHAMASGLMLSHSARCEGLMALALT